MGIGLGIATAFVEAGANVMIVARRTEALATASEQLRSIARPDQQISTAQADTSDVASIEALFETIDRTLPRLDTFVANAGSGKVVPFIDVTLEDWRHTLDFNLTGTFLCVQRAAQRMVTSDAPNRSILVVSSIRSLGVRPGLVPYAVTKAGLNQLVRVSAYELASAGVRVNGILPGITITPLVMDNNPDILAERVATIPMGRAGRPDDMGRAARFVCSPNAAFITGINVPVDGGESLW
jgi:NAD(P)-dependent dehydrogenase (short-subunit alcohol dehydrogenase family)